MANEGAVRLEIVAADGLMQLPPAQFPWAKDDDGFRQAFVYRFPSAEYSYGISADQVLPEVSLTETTIHELVETDRRIVSDLELDIREAPLREWTVEVPEDFAVAAVEGDAPTLRPGTFAEVRVPIGASDGAVIVPDTSVRPSERGLLAYVVEGEVARERVLSLGLRTPDGRVEVKSGLEQGLNVVSARVSGLKDGQPAVMKPNVATPSGNAKTPKAG